jgi:hypothetical protein
VSALSLKLSLPALQSARRIPQVAIGDDVVPVEHATRLVAAQFHGNARNPNRSESACAEDVRT